MVYEHAWHVSFFHGHTLKITLSPQFNPAYCCKQVCSTASVILCHSSITFDIDFAYMLYSGNPKILICDFSDVTSCICKMVHGTLFSITLSFLKNKTH